MLQTLNLRRLLYRMLVGIAIVLLLATILLAWEEGYGLGQAAVTVLMLFGTGEAGALDLGQVRPLTRCLAVFTAYAGILGIAMLTGAVVDMVLRYRMPMLFEKKAKKMKNHIVLCGLGRVGYRTFLELEKFGEAVAVIEKDEHSQFVAALLRKKVPVIVADVRNDDSLVRAGVENAKAVIACTNDDLVNLEIALDAREMRPGIRVVVRMFDQRLADKVAKTFGIQVAFSSSALAAPAFAGAAVDKSIQSSFYVEGRLYVNSTFQIPPGSSIAGKNVGSIREKYEVNTIMYRTQGSEAVWAPKWDLAIQASSTIYVVGPFEKVREFERAAGLLTAEEPAAP